MSRQYREIALLALIIFLVFAPSIFSELSTVDDLDAYNWLVQSNFSLKDLFFPKSAGAGYYRPFIGLSYYFDKYVWFLDTRLMHLDNILFHIVNAILVYWLAAVLCEKHFLRTRTVPLLAAFLFGLHPIVTESVNWISGRTDIFACTFILLSTVSLLKYKETSERRYLLITFLALLPGILAKETSLAFLVGGFFIYFAYEMSDDVPVGQARSLLILVLAAILSTILLLVTYNVWLVFLVALVYLAISAIYDVRQSKTHIVKSAILLPLIVTVSAGIFYSIRKLVFTSSLSTIPRTLQLIAEDPNYSLQTFFGAAGFYVKKFFLPFPLNFAIREIDPFYNFLGVAVFFLCLYCIRERNEVSAFFLAGVAFFLPALPLSLGTVTWTAYAERYIYISSAFWAVSVVLWGTVFSERHAIRKYFVSAVSVLLICMAASSFYRTILWQSNLTLLRDTVNKSPNFKTVREDYMVALMKEKDFEEAKNQYKIADSIPTVGYSEKADLNLAVIMELEGKYEDAYAIYENVLEKTKGKSALAYSSYKAFLQARFTAAMLDNDAGSVDLVGARLLNCMRELYAINADPMLLYRAGQLALYLGKRDESRELFEQASVSFPAKSAYGTFAKKLADNLAEKL